MDCKTQLDTAPRNSLEVNNKVEVEAVPVTHVSATPSNIYHSFYESWSSMHMSVTFTCYFPHVPLVVVLSYYCKSIHLNQWMVCFLATQYIVEHYVLTSRILYFQLNRQYVSGRHVSLSVHSSNESLNGICICTMATASPPNSIQKRQNHFGNTSWHVMHSSDVFTAGHSLQGFSCGATGYKCYTRLPQWSMQVCFIAIYHD